MLEALEVKGRLLFEVEGKLLFDVDGEAPRAFWKENISGYTFWTSSLGFMKANKGHL